MLVAEDKYETYRLGYKRGHDRGYEFAKQQSRAEIEGFLCTVTRLEEEKEHLDDMVTNVARTKYELERLLDDKIQRIVVLRFVNEGFKEQIAALEQEVIDAKLEAFQ